MNNRRNGWTLLERSDGPQPASETWKDSTGKTLRDAPLVQHGFGCNTAPPTP